MTPEERIQQLAAERGGGLATLPRAPRLVIGRPKPADAPPAPTARTPKGANLVLSGNWRRLPDDWSRREVRQRLERLETFLAAGVIARILGPDWSRRTNERHVEIVHREGYGFRLCRCYRDHSRFDVSACHTYRRDEPPAITISATRTLGAIARDIENRLIRNGLAEAYRQQREEDDRYRQERAERFRQILAVARAFGGKISPARNWKSSSYPEANVPGGTARCYYDSRIQLDLTIRPDEAITIGKSVTAQQGTDPAGPGEPTR